MKGEGEASSWFCHACTEFHETGEPCPGPLKKAIRKLKLYAACVSCGRVVHIDTLNECSSCSALSSLIYLVSAQNLIDAMRTKWPGAREAWDDITSKERFLE